MTNLLFKLFIKDNNGNTREKYAVLSGIVGIICNIILASMKCTVGIISHSMAITADAINNLSDASSQVVSIYGSHLASKPVDNEHPFGHGRMEYISALVVSFLIFIMGFQLSKNSIEKIINPESVEFKIYTVIVLIISIGIKLWMAYFNGKIFKITGNLNMKAIKLDSLSDCIATSAAGISLFICAFTPFKRADGITGLIVAIVIIYSGIKIIKEIIGNLLGKAPSKELVNSIEEIILKEKEIYGVHDLIVHDYGPGRIIASAHAEVPSDANIIKIHDIIDHAEREISKKLNILMCIHIDPIIVNNEKTIELKESTKKLIEEYDKDFSFHDFKVYEKGGNTNLVFDLVIPHQYKKKSPEILNELQSIFNEKYSNIKLIVTIEHDFV